MKKYILTAIAAILTTSISFAQTNTFPTTGNVGIGTTSPTQALTFAASKLQTFYNTTDQTTNYERAVLGWNTNVFQIALGAGGTGIARNMQLGAAGTFLNLGLISATNAAMELRRDNTSTSTLLAVTSANLQSSSGVQNAIAVVPTFNQSGTAGYRGLWIAPFESATGSGLKYLIDAGTISAANGTGTYASKFNVDNNGNVGTAGGLTVTNGSAEQFSRAIISLQNTQTANAPSFMILDQKEASSNTGFSSLRIRKANSNFSAYIDYMEIDEATNNINFNGGQAVGETRGNVLIPNGSVGIGTSNTYTYKLAVNGSAIATSMTVKLLSDWPDYVFNKNYQLSSLDAVKTYIDQNHHLPDMPSAGEVEKNGLNLGEINKQLTKKVEELTLYLIELKKEVEQLKNKQ